jgi:hypothetical protein
VLSGRERRVGRGSPLNRGGGISREHWRIIWSVAGRESNGVLGTFAIHVNEILMERC